MKFNSDTTVTIDFKRGSQFSLTDRHGNRFWSSTTNFMKQFKKTCEKSFSISDSALCGLSNGSTLLENGGLEIEILISIDIKTRLIEKRSLCVLPQFVKVESTPKSVR